MGHGLNNVQTTEHTMNELTHDYIMCLSKEFRPKEKMNQFQCQSTNFCGPDVDLKVNVV